MKHIYITWNGLHWVARLPHTTICGQADKVRKIVYDYDFVPIFVK